MDASRMDQFDSALVVTFTAAIATWCDGISCGCSWVQHIEAQKVCPVFGSSMGGEKTQKKKTPPSTLQMMGSGIIAISRRVPHVWVTKNNLKSHLKTINFHPAFLEHKPQCPWMFFHTWQSEQVVHRKFLCEQIAHNL